MKKKIKSAHSIFQKLLNRSKEAGDDFNLLLSRYGMERFLYRLSISEFRDQFILKGASLFLVWQGQSYRVTRDADLLGFGSPDPGRINKIFLTLFKIKEQGDGISYDENSLKIAEIREDNNYDGIRVTLIRQLYNARIPLQIDIGFGGFGDAITPAPEEIDYPTIFDFPQPKLKAYTRYTVVAEKFEAMIHLGIANSRMKDFYDIWLMSRLFGFDGNLLNEAIQNTFNRRNTKLPESKPIPFSSAFYDNPGKQTQWKAFIKKTKPVHGTLELKTVIKDIENFLWPVIKPPVKKATGGRWSTEPGWI
ncbi:nucleotidyl transferase AbiEii/AbiGii toxin family protein [Candidatus Riflebacteria bacterium]